MCGIQLSETLPDRFPEGAGGVDHRLPAQDRVPGHPDDAQGRGKGDCHHPFSQGFGLDGFPGNRILPTGATGFRFMGWTCATSPVWSFLRDYIKETYPRLDILINNAAQTVRRPPGFYAHLMENETRAVAQLASGGPDPFWGNTRPVFPGWNIGQTDHVGREKALPVTWNGTGPGHRVAHVRPVVPDSLFL